MWGNIRSTHLVCTECRASVKQPVNQGNPRHPCPKCDQPMRDAGTNLAVPPRRDNSGWRALTAVLDAGLNFHSRCGCCGDGPGYRPRKWPELRNRYHDN
ncbi:hypothetical protein [Nocardia sp. NPDC050406]|uniref:hypothetical protein n=1 Tax=Nocardia sp. NPDC050406 TaxID=3364318 RepID=UPI0037A5815F